MAHGATARTFTLLSTMTNVVGGQQHTLTCWAGDGVLHFLLEDAVAEAEQAHDSFLLQWGKTASTSTVVSDYFRVDSVMGKHGL